MALLFPLDLVSAYPTPFNPCRVAPFSRYHGGHICAPPSRSATVLKPPAVRGLNQQPSDDTHVVLFPGLDECDCPEGFRVCAGRCYHRGPDKLSYTEAEAYCEAKAAHLATPRNSNDNDCVWDLVPGEFDFGWLGYSGGTNASDPHVGADNGTPVGPYTNWRRGSATYILQCVEIYNGEWNDNVSPCASNSYPLCQLRDCHRPQCPDATPEV